MTSLNTALDSKALDPATLRASFDAFWPSLEETLENLPEANVPAPVRTSEDKIDEMHLMLRQLRSQSSEDAALTELQGYIGSGKTSTANWLGSRAKPLAELHVRKGHLGAAEEHLDRLVAEQLAQEKQHEGAKKKGP